MEKGGPESGDPLRSSRLEHGATLDKAIEFRVKKRRRRQYLEWMLQLFVILSVLIPPLFHAEGVISFISILIASFGTALILLGPWEKWNSTRGKETGSTFRFIFQLGNDHKRQEHSDALDHGVKAVWVQEPTMRDRLRAIFLDQRRGMLYEFLQLLLGIASCAQYLYYAYTTSVVSDEDGDGAKYIYPDQFSLYLFFSSTFAVDYLLKLYMADHKISHIFDMYTIAEYFSFAPVMISIFQIWPDNKRSSVLVLGSFRFLRLIRAISSFKQLKRINATDVKVQMATIIATILCIVCTTAGLMLGLEFYDSDENKFRSYHNSLYFTVVTLTTVGYGDMAPTTAIGRALVVAAICLSVVVIPLQSAELTEMMRLASEWKSRVRLTPDYIPILAVGELSGPSVREFVREFFHEDHSMKNLKLILLCTEDPDNDTKIMLRDPRYNKRLVYRTGSPLSVRDLDRVRAQEVVTCFVLHDKYCKDPIQADRLSMVNTLAIKEYKPEIRMIVHLFSEDTKAYIRSSLIPGYDQLICSEEIRMRLLAHSSVCAGFSTFLLGLIHSLGQRHDLTDGYLTNYWHGITHEMYRVTLPPAFVNKPFYQCAMAAYIKCRIVIFGVKIQLGDGSYKIALNPHEYKIHSGDVAYCFALNQEQANSVSEAQYADILKESPESSPQEPTDDGSRRRSMSTNRSSANWRSVGHLGTVIQNVAQRSPLERAIIESTFNLQGHIIVCGFSPALETFVSTLRSETMQDHVPIVFLSSRVPSRREWERIGQYADVFFLQGTSLSLTDLRRAGYQVARQVVVMSDTGESENLDDSLIDISSILTHRHLLAGSRVRSITELFNGTSMKFMGEDSHLFSNRAATNGDRPDDDLYLAPAFVSGHAYCASMLDSMMVQVFYNPDLLPVVEQVLHGEQFIGEYAQSRFLQVDVPEPMVDKTYEELFSFLCTWSKMLPLGLFIGGDDEQNRPEWVYMCPKPDTVVHRRDKVFVLFQQVNTITHNPVGSEQVKRVKGTVIGSDIAATLKEFAETEENLQNKVEVLEQTVAQMRAELDRLQGRG